MSSVYNRASLNNKIYVSFPSKLNFDLDRGVFPMVIQAVVDEGDGRFYVTGFTHTGNVSIWIGEYKFGSKFVLTRILFVLLKIVLDMHTYFWQPLKEYVYI